MRSMTPSGTAGFFSSAAAFFVEAFTVEAAAFSAVFSAFDCAAVFFAAVFAGAFAAFSVFL